jgi:hypothetical protein
MQHPRTPLPGPDDAHMAKPFSQPDILCAVTGRTALSSSCAAELFLRLHHPAAMPAS